ncbi:hypothetical protein SLA2020_192600 [Shorea laevis]
MFTNRRVLLNNYVRGYPKVTDFRLDDSAEVHLSITDGAVAVLLKNLYLSCDPYMRHRMSNSVTHPGTIIHSFSPDSVLEVYGVAEVMDSTHPDFEKGNIVWGLTGWEQYTTVKNPEKLNKINHILPLSYYAGFLGMPGLSAYVGFYELCAPKQGETVYVSSAAGGVGQLVGQFAKMAGCYVVGSASTKERVEI